jgi:hypothetical protein
MRLRRFLICCLLDISIAAGQAYAWGPDGHQTVAAIADNLIEGSNAAKEVKNILGDPSLEAASVWADCAKGVDPCRNYTYQTAGRYRECKQYETPEREAEMNDFVRRNDKNCDPKSCEESCHKQYHYADVAVQHDRYDRSFFGARDYDIVNAVAAATRVLKGDPAPVPFSFKGKREALLLLAHYVGDIHQPLHVGALYLDAEGKPVNPDAGTFDPKTDTHGGNSIMVEGGNKNLHALWDDIPVSLKTTAHLNADLLKQAGTIPVTGGQVYDWPARWASDTMGAARQAFEGLAFTYRPEEGHWVTELPVNYFYKMDGIKRIQLVKAGARLAQLLKTIWP